MYSIELNFEILELQKKTKKILKQQQQELLCDKGTNKTQKKKKKTKSRQTLKTIEAYKY